MFDELNAWHIFNRLYTMRRAIYELTVQVFRRSNRVHDTLFFHQVDNDLSVDSFSVLLLLLVFLGHFYIACSIRPLIACIRWPSCLLSFISRFLSCLFFLLLTLFFLYSLVNVIFSTLVCHWFHIVSVHNENVFVLNTNTYAYIVGQISEWSKRMLLCFVRRTREQRMIVYSGPRSRTTGLMTERKERES
jgi:hypothetical protein